MSGEIVVTGMGPGPLKHRPNGRNGPWFHIPLPVWENLWLRYQNISVLLSFSLNHIYRLRKLFLLVKIDVTIIAIGCYQHI